MSIIQKLYNKFYFWINLSISHFSQIFHNPGKMTSSRARKAYPLALVLSPTRELTLQIYKEACKFAYRSNLKEIVIFSHLKFLINFYLIIY